MPSYPLDHVGIAVDSIGAMRPIFEALAGNGMTEVFEIPGQGVNVAFIGEVELIEPRGPESPVARFLERRGPGLHHIAYRVSDIVEALGRAREQGFEPIDPEPRPGARGHRVAFLHPKSAGGVLVELVQPERTSP